MTSLDVASMIAMSLSFVALGLLAWTEVWPRVRGSSAARALVPLLWVHAGRHVALQLYSAQAHGFDVSDSVRNQIAYGDLAGMLLALLCLAGLHWRWPAVRTLLWVFVVVTVADLANALRGGLVEDLLGKATDVSWLILNFYVPALWITVGLVAVILVTRSELWADPSADRRDT